MIRVSRDGLPFRLAYYFVPESERPQPDTLGNLCPFFWRMTGVALSMPFWVLLWWPLAFILGFWFAARPRIPHVDGHYQPAWRDSEVRRLLAPHFAPYVHWPKVGSGHDAPRVWPLVVGVVGALLYLGLSTFVGRIAMLTFALLASGSWLDDELRQRHRYFMGLGDADARPKKSERRGEPLRPREPGFVSIGWVVLKNRIKGLCPVVRFI